MKKKAKISVLSKLVKIAPLLALFFSFLSLFGTIYNTYAAYVYTLKAQDRQIAIEAIVRLDHSSNMIGEVGRVFIAAINTQGDLAASRSKMADFASRQLLEVENLKRIFKDNRAIVSYQNAIVELVASSQRVSTPVEMRPWVENFGRAIDAKGELVGSLFDSVELAV